MKLDSRFWEEKGTSPDETFEEINMFLHGYDDWKPLAEVSNLLRSLMRKGVLDKTNLAVQQLLSNWAPPSGAERPAPVRPEEYQLLLELQEQEERISRQAPKRRRRKRRY